MSPYSGVVRLPLSAFRFTPLGAATLLSGSTPQVRFARRQIATDLALVVSDRDFGGFEQTLPDGRVVALNVRVSVENGHVFFDPRELAEQYGQEIDGITTLVPVPILSPVTPEEHRLAHNLQALGATRQQINIALQNHRSQASEEELAAALFGASADISDVDAIRRAARRTRRESAQAGPLTPSSLDEVFPGLRDAARGSTLRPSNEYWFLLPEELVSSDDSTVAVGRSLVDDIRSIDASYDPPELLRAAGFPATVEARSDYLNLLRFERAIVLARHRRDYGPLQVEMLRQMQIDVDASYQAGLTESAAGRLTVHLSDREALGNYVDRYVRDKARLRTRNAGIDWATDPHVRIQRREYDSLGDDATYRIPDVAVFDIMFDASLQQKTSRRRQIRGYFASLSRPRGVVIVRPSALRGIYLIMRPEDPEDGE